jgi:tetratricopeptide (TPR) repeat protein
MVPSPAVPIDIASARALYLLDAFSNIQFKDEATQKYAAQQVKAMCEASQTDRALTAVERFMENLPPRQRVNRPPMYLQWQTRLSNALRNAREDAQVRQLDARSPVDRAWALTSLGPYLGLMDQATAALEQARPDPQITRMLGDLYLRQGRPDEARAQYGKLLPTGGKSSPAGDWQVPMRLALCDWAQGRLFVALDQLKQLSQTAREPLVAYYCAMLLEEIGQPADAKAAIADAKSDDPQLARLIGLLRDRL